jgi:hypothetical protein
MRKPVELELVHPSGRRSAASATRRAFCGHTPTAQCTFRALRVLGSLGAVDTTKGRRISGVRAERPWGRPFRTSANSRCSHLALAPPLRPPPPRESAPRPSRSKRMTRATFGPSIEAETTRASRPPRRTTPAAAVAVGDRPLPCVRGIVPSIASLKPGRYPTMPGRSTRRPWTGARFASPFPRSANGLLLRLDDSPLRRGIPKQGSPWHGRDP